MADNENARKPHYVRRNPPNRPPVGVQKAINNFGVRDLRELLDKKHQEQGDSQDDKNSQRKLPPPDPSYNYLSDPSRDKPKSPPPKKEEYRRPQDKDKHHGIRNSQHRFKNENTQRPRNREQENNNPPQNSPLVNEEGAGKKELRFSDADKVIEGESQFARGARSSFRGRYSRRGQGERPRENREEKIENPFNIKIQLSTETGQRSCTLDENTKIADIKHVPDQTIPSNRPPRGGFRGGFRGRGRGRGSFRGRGGTSNRRGRPSNTSGNSDTPENSDLKDEPVVEQQLNNEIEATETSPATEQQDNTENQINVNNEAHLEEYHEYEQETNENDEFVDSNENYDEDDSTEPVQSIDDQSEKHKAETASSFNANLAETITITSSKYHDGEVKRSIEVKATNDGEEEGNNDKSTKEGGE